MDATRRNRRHLHGEMAPLLFAACFLVLPPLGCSEQTHPPIQVESPGSLSSPQPAEPKRKPDPPPVMVPELLRGLDAVSEKLAPQIFPGMPEGKTIAILAFEGPGGGVYRLGEMISDHLQRRAVERKLRILDRAHVRDVLREHKHLAGQANECLKGAGTLLGASVLVVGRTEPLQGKVAVTAKAIDVATGQVLSVTKTEEIASPGLADLLWYVRRPESAHAGRLPPLSFEYELVTPTPQGLLRLTDNAVVHDEQKFRVRVKAISDCYLYVLLFDSQGRLSALFPGVGIAMSNRVSGGCWYDIPDGSKWFWFDRHPGMETFYLLTSYKPLTGLDGLLRTLKDSPDPATPTAAKVKVEVEVATRGMSEEGQKRYTPEGYTIQERGVWGVFEDPNVSGPNDIHPLASVKRADRVVLGLSTAARKITLQHSLGE